MRCLVPDSLWEQATPPLPAHRYRYLGRKPVTDRTAMAAIVFVVKSGLARSQLPRRTDWVSQGICWRRSRELAPGSGLAGRYTSCCWRCFGWQGQPASHPPRRGARLRAQHTPLNRRTRACAPRGVLFDLRLSREGFGGKFLARTTGLDPNRQRRTLVVPASRHRHTTPGSPAQPLSSRHRRAGSSGNHDVRFGGIRAEGTRPADPSPHGRPVRLTATPSRGCAPATDTARRHPPRAAPARLRP
ncbi:transposase [Amycolatopsis acidiphila]|uniref:Transposase n=1 Tax=Amycolatopsis acidiphila TaxID=715473 RepID=A0A558AI06_9PSEU|nr:transposase [Amycolatopsis acidiphila]